MSAWHCTCNRNPCDGLDASEDGTGRGTPIVPTYAIQERAVAENPNAGPQGSGVRGDGSSFTLEARNKPQAVAFQTSGNCGAWETGAVTGALDTNTDPNSHVICFSAKDYGADAIKNLAPTLRAGGFTDSHQNGGIMPALAFAENSRCELRLCGGDGAVSSQLTTGGGKPGQGQPCIVAKWQVRRLTPRECERLQGFPDDWTNITYRGKPAADGPRYKAVGNSMAVNVMRWLGERIEYVERTFGEPAVRGDAA